MLLLFWRAARDGAAARLASAGRARGEGRLSLAATLARQRRRLVVFSGWLWYHAAVDGAGWRQPLVRLLAR